MAKTSRIYLVFALELVLIVAVGVFAYIRTDQLITANRSAALTHEVLRGESGTGPILLNWAAPPTSERSSPGRGILISAHLSRATRGTIGRL